MSATSATRLTCASRMPSIAAWTLALGGFDVAPQPAEHVELPYSIEAGLKKILSFVGRRDARYVLLAGNCRRQ